ncbi:type II secretion system F family protein [Nocardioides nitrophenolicus]|uniref:type II secretion system F family protein n=1 Tax=Nocardioides nitrophenolicus TaxID=60489 RepID=UPI00195C7C42|nr:type II secretion system F family protein [Nocardioides nitrophenolicus]MBM7516017.1 tight adherence protein C [Nocardioides nitrophenolicus]
MSPLVAGALLGLVAALGLVLVVARLTVPRRPGIEDRVLPYLRDLTPARRTPAAGAPGSAVALLGPVLRRAADGVERVLGGAPSVRRRLARAGSTLTVHELRVQQVQWGLAGFALAAAAGLLRSWTHPGAAAPLLVACAAAFGSGVLLRDQRLSAQVRRRESAMLAEFPTVAELLALSVSAGEGPVGALDRVVRRSGGELSRELGDLLARVRTGEPIADAFDRLAATTGLGVVARFAHGIAVAVERGTPLADVLHAQAADVREAGRRALIEQASRKEIAMMVPVVFLVLPTTVLFAFWPGLIGLSLSY